MNSTKEKSDTYVSICCVIPAELEDELPELMAPWGVLGTEIGDRTDRGVRVTVFLPGADAQGAEGVCRLLLDHGAYDLERGLREADDWLAGFREQARPFEVGGCWWIDPHPDRPTAALAGRRRLVIEPRMAFGTGSHESTRAILLTLEDLEVEGRRVLDVGTGSGILSLAAECMGANMVVGLDIDPTAIWVASEIARQQDWPSRVNFVLGPIGCLGDVKFDIVLCNMIASSFLPLMRDLRELLGPTGVVVFSGLLGSEAASVSTALESNGLEVVSSRFLGEWASLLATAVPVP